MTTMGSEPSGWEPWQEDYRHGAFYIFPPAGVIEALDELRQRYDPKSHAICQAHVSLSVALPRALTDESLSELQSRVREVPPFEVTYGPLRSYPPYPGVCYEVGPCEPFDQLREVLHGAAAFVGAVSRSVPPHLTIAEFISLERTAELLELLRERVPTGTFHCDHIVQAAPNSAFFFERKRLLRLGV